ncbi:MAG: hypothetical protein JXR76_11660 [Deltaproteobacteria bacterium]|nr:hypothetical protein [Deltaproteobacteria bacterium]
MDCGGWTSGSENGFSEKRMNMHRSHFACLIVPGTMFVGSILFCNCGAITIDCENAGVKKCDFIILGYELNKMRQSNRSNKTCIQTYFEFHMRLNLHQFILSLLSSTHSKELLAFLAVAGGEAKSTPADILHGQLNEDLNGERMAELTHRSISSLNRFLNGIRPLDIRKK